MEPYATYTSALVALSIALLLVSSGLAKKQLEWKRPRHSPSVVAGASRSGIRPTLGESRGDGADCRGTLRRPCRVAGGLLREQRARGSRRASRGSDEPEPR